MRRTTGTALAAALALAAVAAPAALARGGDDGGGDDRGGRGGGDRVDVRRPGACTGSSTAKIKLGPEDRGVEVEFEVDQNRVGVPWRVVLLVNGAEVLRRTVRTTAPSGSFEVRRIAGRAGTARVSATATRLSGGEVCRASARLAA